MTQRIPCHASRQVTVACRHFHQAAGLPFADLLPDQRLNQALQDEHVRFRTRLFTPAVTLWMFLSQVLDVAHCCRQAVARFLAWRLGQGLAPCSANAGAYCKARGRLPEGVFVRLVRDSGQQVQEQVPATWRWHGRTVKVVDGTTVSLPDTPANQQAFPQPRSQKPGVGFPLVRMVVLFSLAVGTALDAAFGPYRGKRTGEPALFRSLHEQLAAGDLLLGDRCFCSYWELAFARSRQADAVFRLHQCRRVDFRRGRRLGRSDHVVTWTKPPRPDWMSPQEYEQLPAELEVREVRIVVRRPGYRTKVLLVATTLLDAEAFPWLEIALLYRVRWYAELDLRALKDTLGMGVLRGQTPAMVRKEIWVHLLAYNLIRGLIAQAAEAVGVLPWQLSFAGAVQTVLAFAPLAWTATTTQWEAMQIRLWVAIAEHRVNNRLGRSEPRAQKRRPQTYPLLSEPRPQARERLIGRSCG